MLNNFLKKLRFREKGNSNPLYFCSFANISSQRVKDIGIRAGETPASINRLSDPPVHEGVDGFGKFRRIKISFNLYLNIDRNFVNHIANLLGNFSSFRKGLFRGLIDNLKLAQLTSGNKYEH
jgi:hypothetical protein